MLRRRVIALIVVGVSGCSCTDGRPPEQRGYLERPRAWPADKVRVAVGGHWVLPAAARTTIPVTRDGQFSFENGRRAATAFLDVDGDGALTPFHEPAAQCYYYDDRYVWHCRLTPARLVTHRLVTSDGSDVTTVIGESFDPETGAPSGQTALCDAETGTCAEVGDTDWPATTSTGVRSMSLCNTTGAPRIRHTAGDGTRTVPVVTPPPNPLKVVSWFDDGERMQLLIASALPIDRALVWVSDASDRTVWTSEESPEHVALAGSAAIAEVPAWALGRCDYACDVHVKAASVSGTRGGWLPTQISEGLWQASVARAEKVGLR